VSGGFKLTRQYAGIVNRQHIILRVVLYILTSVVFAVTLIADAVIFNTMDFWEGRVSANDYQFEKDGKFYAVRHSYKGDGSQLRNSEIEIYDGPVGLNVPEKIIRLSEREGGKIEVFEDGRLTAVVKSIYDLPQVTRYDQMGMPLTFAPMRIALNK